MPATTNPSAAHPRANGAAARRAPLRRNEELYYREAGPGPRPPSGATGTRRTPLTRQFAFYDLSQPTPFNAFTPGPAAPGAGHRVPLTRQFAFINAHTAAARPGASVHGAAAPAQTSSAAGAQQPSATAGLGDMVAAILAASAKRKRTSLDDVETGDAKRRRVGSNAQPLSRAEGRQTSGKPASADSTGATASPHQYLNATAASSAARDAPVAPTKSAGTGQEPRPIATMPKRGGLVGPSTPRRVSPAMPSGPPPAPEPKRVRGKRTGSETNAGVKDENEADAPAVA